MLGVAVVVEFDVVLVVFGHLSLRTSDRIAAASARANDEADAVEESAAHVRVVGEGAILERGQRVREVEIERFTG